MDMAHSSDPSHREKTPRTQGSNSATRNLLRKKEQRRRGIRSSSPMGRVILINSPVDGEEWVGDKGDWWGCSSQTADRLMEQLGKGYEVPHYRPGLISESDVDEEKGGT